MPPFAGPALKHEQPADQRRNSDHGNLGKRQLDGTTMPKVELGTRRPSHERQDHEGMPNITRLGFEPRQAESESAVLPLHNRAIMRTRQSCNLPNRTGHRNELAESDQVMRRLLDWVTIKYRAPVPIAEQALLFRSDRAHDLFGLPVRRRFELTVFGQFFNHTLNDSFAFINVSQLPTFVHDRDLNLVLVLQEPDRLFDLEINIMIAGSRS
jgi:hypothetical protein